MERRLVPIIAVVISVSSNAAGAGRWIQVSGGPWVASAKTLHAVQERLESHVRTQAQAAGRSLQDWNTYTFQYQGQAVDGRRYLLVNALCSIDVNVNLHERFVVVLDGGSCYFSVKYDPSLERFYDLVINGDA